MVGIKVDKGTTALALHGEERVTEGLDGLRDRLKAYAGMGASFAKWRGVIAIDAIGSGAPSRAGLSATAHALARFAALCQDAGIVPVIEPEVTAEGTHAISRCAEITEEVLRHVFTELAIQGVELESVVLKPNMVTGGLQCTIEDPATVVADATIRSLLRTVPGAVPGIAFLSGGQPGPVATARLNEMNRRSFASGQSALPWELSFSFSRALQNPALAIWAGHESNRDAAQHALIYRAERNCNARRGAYDPSMDQT
jgi:fructose-bisphosphate aldolase class I